LIFRVFVFAVNVNQKLGDGVTEVANRDFLFGLFFGFFVLVEGVLGLLCGNGFGEDLGWVNPCGDHGFHCSFAFSAGSLALQVICYNFDVVDEVICEVDSSGEVI
jgi:hypothetical protein